MSDATKTLIDLSTLTPDDATRAWLFADLGVDYDPTFDLDGDSGQSLAKMRATMPDLLHALREFAHAPTPADGVTGEQFTALNDLQERHDALLRQCDSLSRLAADVISWAVEDVRDGFARDREAILNGVAYAPPLAETPAASPSPR